MKRTCETCKWEPMWQKVERYYYQGKHGGLVLRTVERAQCRFPTGHRSVRAARLPQGTSISPPYVERDKLKHNCPAWAQKDGETE